MNTSDNRTVLLPTAQAQDSLTGFTPASQESGSFKKNAPASQPNRQWSALREHDTNFIQGTNPFLALAAPLFRHLDELLHTYDVKDAKSVHAGLTEEIETFTENAAKEQLDNSSIMVTRYLLCTFLDELISTTYWGKETNWSNNSLLSYFYHETYGGEKFFHILEKMLVSPAKHVHLLEVMYVCISLGFEGKFRIQTKGKMELDAIRDNLYKQIKTVHGRQSQKFFTEQQTSSQQHRLFYKASYPVLVASVAVMLSIIYGILTISLSEHENDFMHYIERQTDTVKAERFTYEIPKKADTGNTMAAPSFPSVETTEAPAKKDINEEI